MSHHSTRSFSNCSTRRKHRNYEVWSPGCERRAEVSFVGWWHSKLRLGSWIFQTSHRWWLPLWHWDQAWPAIHYQPHTPPPVGPWQPVRPCCICWRGPNFLVICFGSSPLLPSLFTGKGGSYWERQCLCLRVTIAIACSACFLMEPRTTSPGMTHTPHRGLGSPLPHQLLRLCHTAAC